MQYDGLRRVISGGQCGADRGALEEAKSWGIETGGWAPRGWRTEFGPAPELADFGLVEHYSADYRFRTEKNIIESDATLIVASSITGGTLLTTELCAKFKKPMYVVKLQSSGCMGFDEDSFVQFLKQHCVQVLNVAGNRDKPDSTTHNLATATVLNLTFQRLRNLNLLRA